MIARHARARYGVISRREALARGATPRMIHRRVTVGTWERVFPGVYRIAGTLPSWEQSQLAACLAAGAGAVGSHRAAAQAWALASAAARVLELSIPRARRIELPNVIIHRPQDLEPVDLTVYRGIPVTTPTRTLIDLAAAVPTDILEEALDDALRRHLTSLGRIERRLRALGRRGRPGMTTLRILLEGRTHATPESPLETRFFRLTRTARLPAPVPQYEIRHAGRLVARVDFAYPDLRLAIEVDGYEHHAGRARFERDRARLNVLTELGWAVIHVTWAQLRDEPDELIRVIAVLVEQRRETMLRA